MCCEEAKRESEGRKRIVGRGRGGEKTSQTDDRKGSAGWANASQRTLLSAFESSFGCVSSRTEQMDSFMS